MIRQSPLNVSFFLNLLHLGHSRLARGGFVPPKNNRSKGLLSKIKPYGFTLFAKRYGEKMLLDCLERNEKNGILYHRDGIVGDYDEFDDVEKLILFIKRGKR